MREAPLADTTAGLVPEGEGWFVVNARDAAWAGNDELGRYCRFEGDARFPRFGVNIHVLEPGQPNSMYHGEDEQEDFLVLAGECVLVVDGVEHILRQWDFVHFPPWTEHVVVGAGEGPCAILMVGSRTPGSGVRYRASDLAREHRAGVEETTDDPEVAYAPYSGVEPQAYLEGDLPGREPGSG